MANSQSSGSNYKYATVNTNPGIAGYGTAEVSPKYLRKKWDATVFFSIREFEADSSGASDTSTITIHLQFKCPGDKGWQNYVPLDGSSFAVGNRIAIEDSGKDVQWRAWVNDGDYTSGEITFGFDW